MSLPFHCGTGSTDCPSATTIPTAPSPSSIGVKRARDDSETDGNGSSSTTNINISNNKPSMKMSEIRSVLQGIVSGAVPRENYFGFPSTSMKGGSSSSSSTAAVPTGHKAPFIPSSTFDPVSVGLSKEFILTDYTKLKGCSCKVPQPKLLELLHAISSAPPGSARPQTLSATTTATSTLRENDANATNKNVGMDCSIVPLPSRCVDKETGEGLVLVSTTDFFFPSVEDPYLQGRIGAANVLSDLYSMGIYECDSMLMLLAASTDMDEADKYQSTMMIMKGYADCCREAGVLVTGGQTVQNPWPLIGGIAMACVTPSRMVHPSRPNAPHLKGLSKGDIMVLTKPIGNQIAVNVKQWVQRPSPLYQKYIEGNMTIAEIDYLYTRAANGMARLNYHGAKFMRDFKAVTCTDVTGFGLIGHARNLVESQEMSPSSAISIRFDTIPVIRGAVKASLLLGDKYKLFQGLSAETSGGLLIAFRTKEDADGYMKALTAISGEEAWVVGEVVEGKSSSHTAYISDSAVWMDV